MMADEQTFTIRIEYIDSNILLLKCSGCGGLLLHGDRVMKITMLGDSIRIHQDCARSVRDALDEWFSEADPDLRYN